MTTSPSRAWACYDCGKCTASCPLARAGAHYSPRRQVLAARSADAVKAASESGGLFDCLTCGLCDERCPAQVHYTQIVRDLREQAHREGAEHDCPHGGALQSLMRMMAAGGTRQERLGWLDASLQTQPERGEVFLWTGCTAYFDALFPELGVTTLNGTRAALGLLNQMGIVPVVSPEERCCGHDLLWNGDRPNFERLAAHNTALVKASGARTLVVPCAECLRTWKLDYAPFLGGSPLRVLHLTELLAERWPDLGSLHANGGVRVTFQDPCRLGRHLGVYAPPRQVLDAVPGVARSEMRHSGASAVCCAGGTWSHCDRFAKRIQVERLQEARATGAEVLVTACPKCQIHLRCAMRDPGLGESIHIEVRDVAEMVAAAVGAGTPDGTGALDQRKGRTP